MARPGKQAKRVRRINALVRLRTTLDERQAFWKLDSWTAKERERYADMIPRIRKSLRRMEAEIETLEDRT